MIKQLNNLTARFCSCGVHVRRKKKKHAAGLASKPEAEEQHKQRPRDVVLYSSCQKHEKIGSEMPKTIAGSGSTSAGTPTIALNHTHLLVLLLL